MQTRQRQVDYTEGDRQDKDRQSRHANVGKSDIDTPDREMQTRQRQIDRTEKFRQDRYRQTRQNEIDKTEKFRHDKYTSRWAVQRFIDKTDIRVSRLDRDRWNTVDRRGRQTGIDTGPLFVLKVCQNAIENVYFCCLARKITS